MKSYPSYKGSGMEWIKTIPGHWEIIKTKYISEFRNGYSYKSGEWVEKGIPVIRMSNIGDDGKIKLTKKNIRYVSEESLEKTKEYLIKKNDILISMTDMNPLMFWLGSTILFDSEESYLLNQRVGNIRINDNRVNHKYYHYISHSDVVRNQLKVSVYPNVQTNLSTEPIKNGKFPLPPISEQTQIVSFLDIKTQKIDELIEKTEKKIELLKEKRTSLINHCVTKGLNPNVKMKDSGVEWIGEIPSHWDKTKVKYVTEIFGRIGYRGYTTDDIVDEGEGVVTISPSNIKNDIFNLDSVTYLSYEKYYESPEIMIFTDDIIIVKTGSTIGKTSIIPDDVPKMTINPQLVVLKNIKVFPKFLYYQTTCRFIKESFDIEQTGSTTPTISQEKINEFPIIEPPISEQTQIVEYLDEQTQKIDSTIEKETQRIELLKEYRQSLISEVVTGKIDVRDWKE